MKNLIICDIDGTIADTSHRMHYIQGEHKDWDKFFSECVNDKPIDDVLEILSWLDDDSYGNSQVKVLFVSGRSDAVRAQTEDWLRNNVEIFDHRSAGLLMRKAGDHRPDYQVKAELTAHLTPDDVWLVLDDRDQVVKMWRERGFRCLQVANGDF